MSETNGNGSRLSVLAKSASDNPYFKILAQGAMALVVPTLMWCAGALWDLNTKQAKLDGRLDGIQIRIDSNMDNRYRSTDAERDFRLRDQLINFLKDKIDQADKKIERLENRK